MVFLPVADRIFAVFGDADCHTAFCVMGNEFIARGVLGAHEDRYLTFVDPDGALVKSLGLERLPARAPATGHDRRRRGRGAGTPTSGKRS